MLEVDDSRRAGESSLSPQEELYRRVIYGGEDAWQAFSLLSAMAEGQSEAANQAGAFLKELDELSITEGIRLPEPPPPIQNEPSSRIANAVFIAAHPVTTFNALLLRFKDIIHLEDSCWTVAETSRRLWSERRRERSGVPPEAWSRQDQEALEKGERPSGYPEHPNV